MNISIINKNINLIIIQLILYSNTLVYNTLRYRNLYLETNTV